MHLWAVFLLVASPVSSISPSWTITQGKEVWALDPTASIVAVTNASTELILKVRSASGETALLKGVTRLKRIDKPTVPASDSLVWRIAGKEDFKYLKKTQWVGSVVPNDDGMIVDTFDLNSTSGIRIRNVLNMRLSEPPGSVRPQKAMDRFASKSSSSREKSVDVTYAKIAFLNWHGTTHTFTRIALRNGTGEPVSKIFFEASLTTLDRSAPWARGEFYWEIPGGLEAYEEREVLLRIGDLTSSWSNIPEAAGVADYHIEAIRADNDQGEVIFDRYTTVLPAWAKNSGKELHIDAERAEEIFEHQEGKVQASDTFHP